MKLTIRKKPAIIGFLVIAAIGLLVAANLLRSHSSSSGVLVETEKVAKGKMELTVLSDGKVEPLEQKVLYCQAGGRLLSLKVKVGDTVKKGQVIAVFDDADAKSAYEQAKTALASAQSDMEDFNLKAQNIPERNRLNLQKAQLALDKAQEDLDKVAGGATQTEIAAAKTTLEQDKNNLETIRLDYEKNKVTEDDLEEAEDRLDAAKEDYRAATWSYDYDDPKDMSSIKSAELGKTEASNNLKKLQDTYTRQEQEYAVKLKDAQLTLEKDQAALKELLQGSSQKDAQFSLEDAQAALDIAALDAKENVATATQRQSYQARVEEAQADLDKAASNLANTRLKSSMNGVVLDIPVEEGTIATDATQIATVAQVDTIIVKANVDEAEIGKIRGGEKVEITSNAYLGETFPGKVTRVYPQAKVQDSNSSGQVATFTVEISVANKKGLLKPGMSVDAKIITQSHNEALQVPLGAILEENNHFYVYVLNKGKAKKVFIETGSSNDISMEIISGLKAGDEIITGDFQTLQTLKSGEQVTSKNAGSKKQ